MDWEAREDARIEAEQSAADDHYSKHCKRCDVEDRTERALVRCESCDDQFCPECDDITEDIEAQRWSGRQWWMCGDCMTSQECWQGPES